MDFSELLNRHFDRDVVLHIYSSRNHDEVSASLRRNVSKEEKKKYREEIQAKKYGKQKPLLPLDAMIEKVIFQEPYTIVIWKDGVKTKVRCAEGDRFDEMEGLAYAVLKRICGNDNAYHTLFTKYLPASYLDD